jgi:RecA/RadA recombinase
MSQIHLNIPIEGNLLYFALQQKLAQMLSRMTKIAEEFNIAVFMTNQGETSFTAS